MIIKELCVDLNKTPILKSISLMLKPKALTIMCGPNGSGKTTLLRAMCGLLAHKSGSVLIENEAVSAMNAAKRASKIAYLPQDRPLYWDLSALDVAALGAGHLDEAAAKIRAIQALQGLGLADLAERSVSTLSGGQRSRVLLARLLAAQAKTLLLDEPLLALDPVWQRRVLAHLKTLCRDGYQILVSLHDLGLAAQYADEIILLNHGQLIAQNSPENVFTDKNLYDVFELSGEYKNGELSLDAFCV